MKLFVQGNQGKIRMIDVEPTMKVIQLKKLIAEKEGIPIPHQRLMHVGKQMEDLKTLTEYSVQKDSTIQIILPLKGGFNIYIRCLNG